MKSGVAAAGIEELSSLNDLQGQFSTASNWLIRRGGDGHEEDDNIYGKDILIMKNKQGLELLILSFKLDVDDDRSAAAECLLESLQPHTNIKVLDMYGYPGGRLPTWLGHSSYVRLERICLCGPMNSCQVHLIAFGQLPSLNGLGLVGVAVSCRNLLGTASFPSLEKLILYDVRECEEEDRHMLSIGTDGGGSFPRLRSLKISVWPKLECLNLRHLTSLKQLHIRDCPELSELDYYYNDDDDGVVLQIDSCPKLTSTLPVPLPSQLWSQT